MDITTNTSNNHRLYYWNTLIILFIFSMILGIIGFQKYFIFYGEEQNLLRSAYRTLQLFALEGGDLSEHIPWELQAARFGAPLTAIMAFIIAFMEIFKERWRLIKISRMKNHVVIIGLGTKGKNVTGENLQKKEKVLVIESNPLNPNLAYVKSLGSKYLISDAANKSTLKKAGITKAKSVYLLMKEDTDQVNVCLLIYQLIKESKRDEKDLLICIMHLEEQEFLNTMRNHKLIQDEHDGLALNIFNVYENSARELFEENPPDRSGIVIDSKNYVQILIIGFGRTGEALALQTAITGHYINGKKPKVIIVDRLSEQKVIEFLARFPAYQNYCDIHFLSLEASSPQLIQHLVKYIEDPNAFTSIVLCFDNKTQNVLLGLQLEGTKLNEKDTNLQVFVRTNDNESFATFSQNIKPYGLPSKVCSQEVILEGNLDKKARSIHNDYLKKRKNSPNFGSRKADSTWENLSQELKDSNRKAADHIGVKIRGIGCEIVNENDSRPAATFSADEIEKLSELEHRRWNAERSLAGWIYDEHKNDKTRKTPYLTDWNKLSEDIKEYDRDAVKNIPKVLQLIGLKAVRKETAK